MNVHLLIQVNYLFIYLVIASVFRSRVMHCGWHIQKKMLKNFAALANSDPVLYRKLISLPFISRKSKFDDYVTELNENISSHKQRQLFRILINNKHQWAKSTLKEEFGGGVSTTSRVEGLYGVLQKCLNSKSSLQNIFYCFREIEEVQIEKYHSTF